MKKLFAIILILSNTCFADNYKFHYGDKVKWQDDFYGECRGEINSISKAKNKELDCYKTKDNIVYQINNPFCNNHNTYSNWVVCEEGLTKIE